MEKSIIEKEYYKKSKVFLLLLAHDIIQRGSIILERSIITQTSIIGGENVLSINQVLWQLALYYTKEVLFFN